MSNGKAVAMMTNLRRCLSRCTVKRTWDDFDNSAICEVARM